MKISLLILVIIAPFIQAQAQLFVDNGANGSVNIRNASGGYLGSSEAFFSDVAIFVDGNILIEGAYTNQGAEVQLTGDFDNNGIFTTTGDEVFLGNAVQELSGNFINANDFYNLILKDTLLNLTANIEIDSTGKLVFESGVLKTNSNFIYIKNSTITSVDGAGVNGSLDKFVEGELRRMVVEGVIYDFPIGGTHVDAGGGDGVQYASLKSNSGDGIISAIFQDSTGIGVADNTIICPTGIGDFQDVEYRIRNGAWLITNIGGGIINYDITLNPIDYTDIGYIDYTILKDALPTGRDMCDGVASFPPITHDSLTSFSVFEVAASTLTVLLPIELINFTATSVNNEVVLLEWQTLSEFNNDYFTVQNSRNGVEWNSVRTLDGAGNSSNILTYSLVDERPFLGTSYYRLKQTDFDGNFSYSDVRSVNILLTENSQFSIYPNPTHGRFIVNGENVLNEIRIYDFLGQDVTYLSTIEFVDSTRSIVDLMNLKSGIYTIRINNEVDKLYKL